MNDPTLRAYNTLSHQKEPIVPQVPGKLGFYVCGPTVYDFIHIGNARTFTSFDTVVRYLRYRGFEVKYVRNYTDVDDKIINAAKAQNVAPNELAERFIAEFEADARALHLLKPDVSPRVTQTIPEIVALVQKLIDRQVAYEAQGDVYFQVSKYPEYARLSRRDLEDQRATDRVLPLEHKRDPLDFALWKAAKPGEPSWESPWGKGRPGWHIECSAMVAKHLGETVDLHAGGIDLIFPHHENEIAQSQAASGKGFCRYWLHGGFLDLEGVKMSKSLGNIKKLRDALEAVDAEALKYFFLSTHYRAQLSFTEKSLTDAEMRLEYFYETLKKVDARLDGKDPGAGGVHQEPERFKKEFESVVDDDFNFAGGLGVLSGLFSAMNELTDKPPVKDKAVVLRTLRVLRDTVTGLSTVLGLFEDAPAEWLKRRRDRQVKTRGIDLTQVDALLAKRQAARATKSKEGYAESDALRAQLREMGVEVMDTPAGQEWKVA